MIYIIESEKQQAIKIGYIVDKSDLEKSFERLRARVSGIQVGNPWELKIIGLIKGNYAEEQELHKQFSTYRLCGEWFSNCYEVMSIVRGMMSAELWKAYKSPKEKPEYSSEFEKLEQGRYQVSFKNLVEEYVELQEKAIKTKYMQRCIVLAETRYPWLKEAYEKLGGDTFRRVKYVQEAIKRESAAMQKTGVKEKVRLMLNLQLGFRYSSQELKQKFKGIREHISGIPGTASAVEEYYKVKKTRWVCGGKKVVGYIIQGVK